MLQILLTGTKQPSGLFWVIYILILFAVTIVPIIIHIKKKKNKKNYIQLLEEQNRLLREQLNRDK